MQLRYTLLAAVLLAVAASAATDRKLDGSARTGRVVELVGQTGTLKFFANSTKNAPWIMVDPGMMNCGHNKLINVANVDWSEPVVGTDTWSSTFSASSLSMDLSQTTTLYAVTKTVTYANTTVTVPAYALKFSFTATGKSGTPIGATEACTYTITIRNKGGAAGQESTDAGKKKKSVMLAEGEMDFPTVALINGAATDITVAVSAIGSSKSFDITFTFPKPASTTIDSIMYDPVIALDSAAGHVIAQWPLLLVAMLVALLAAVRL